MGDPCAVEECLALLKDEVRGGAGEKEGEGGDEEREDDEEEVEEGEDVGCGRSVFADSSSASGSSCALVEEAVEACSVVSDEDGATNICALVSGRQKGCAPLLDQASFICLSENDIWNKQVELCSTAASALGMSYDAAGILLRHFDFDLAKLLQSWDQDEDGVRHMTGLTSHHWPGSRLKSLSGTLYDSRRRGRRRRRRISGSPRSPLSSPPPSSSCTITLRLSDDMEEEEEEEGGRMMAAARQCRLCANQVFSAEEVRTLRCGHSFCSHCWTSSVHQALEREGGASSLSMRCLLPFCDTAVSESDILAGACGVEDLATYRWLVVLRLLRGSTMVKAKACPGDKCRFAVELLAEGKDGTADVTCEGCGHRFCWRCLHEPHRPAQCENVLKWAKMLDEKAERPSPSRLQRESPSVAETDDAKLKERERVGRFRRSSVWRRWRINWHRKRLCSAAAAAGSSNKSCQVGGKKKLKESSPPLPSKPCSALPCVCGALNPERSIGNSEEEEVEEEGDEEEEWRRLFGLTKLTANERRRKERIIRRGLRGGLKSLVSGDFFCGGMPFEWMEKAGNQSRRSLDYHCRRLDPLCHDEEGVEPSTCVRSPLSMPPMTAVNQPARGGEGEEAADRFVMFAERWAEHEWRQAGVMWDLKNFIAEDIIILSKEGDLPLSSLELVEQAIWLVVECRRVLKWTCVQEFFTGAGDNHRSIRSAHRGCKDDDADVGACDGNRNNSVNNTSNGSSISRSAFLVYLQSEAEAKLNRLHRCAAKELRRFLKDFEDAHLVDHDKDTISDFQSRLLDLLHSIRSYFRNLVLEIENDDPRASDSTDQRRRFSDSPDR